MFGMQPSQTFVKCPETCTVSVDKHDKVHFEDLGFFGRRLTSLAWVPPASCPPAPPSSPSRLCLPPNHEPVKKLQVC